MPMTSPVDRISGPRVVDAGELHEREHGLLDGDVLGRDLDDTHRLERLARGDARRDLGERDAPVTFDTKGTVRDARGLTLEDEDAGWSSRGTANCTFMRPRTSSLRARARAWVLIASTVSGLSE